MRIRELQDSLKKLLNIMDMVMKTNLISTENMDLDLILSAKIMALDLLKEDNPKEVLLEAFIQLFLVASIINLDLEKEAEKVLYKYSMISAHGG